MLALDCRDITIRNCQRVGGVDQNLWDLDYSFQIPSNCPVPLGGVGEWKDAGAEIIDNAPFDFRFAEVYVRSSDGSPRAYGINTFSELATYAYSLVATGYSAAQGCNCVTFPSNTADGALLPSRFFDYGTFNATNFSGSLEAWSEIEISYSKSSMILAVSGPDVPLGNATGTWNAPTSGGSEPYTYQWYRNGELVGTASSYTTNVGSDGFGLRVWATDQTQSTRWADYWVDVDGVRVAVTGPSTVYASQNGGTWTASGRGGYQPYTFDWFIEDSDGNSEYVGSGQSWSGYPGAGSRRVRARLTDSHGALHDSFELVTGIGDEQCQPQPPAVTC
jgi:hypothetical protein